jgi:oxygen-independent coproporphyrinogen-3 oxidase
LYRYQNNSSFLSFFNKLISDYVSYLCKGMAGLYIHIPFCAQKCAYCDFYSRPGSAKAIRSVLDGLKREMEYRRDFFTPSKLDTVYVGGGTPSSLAPEQLQELLDKAAELWDCSQIREATVEANPEDLTCDYLVRLASTGFNRLSIGIQSFDDNLLCLMNRRHNADRAREAVKSAQKAGLDNISVDLIYGIPGMTRAQWEHTLDEAVALGIQHISAYHLTIEPGTAFGRMARTGSLKPVTEPESERQYETLCRKLGDVGFEHYEISNFALPGRCAVHNSAYWSGEPYLGIGPSAHSFDGKRERQWVYADTAKYIAEAGTNTIYDGEILSDTDLFNERVMTSLRTAEGLDISGQPIANHRIEKFIADGSLVQNGSNIAIPPEKFLLSDYIISSLFKD